VGLFLSIYYKLYVVPVPTKVTLHLVYVIFFDYLFSDQFTTSVCAYRERIQLLFVERKRVLEDWVEGDFYCFQEDEDILYHYTRFLGLKMPEDPKRKRAVASEEEQPFSDSDLRVDVDDYQPDRR
jgi:hypothetical protein